MTQGPFSERGKRPLLFMPFFGKQARKGGIHGERTAGGISGAVPHGSSQRRHQPGVGTDLRRDGVPIASNGSGYFYAATDQEVRATIAHLTRRISGIAAAIRGLDRTLEREDTAQTRLPLDGGDTP